MCMMTTLFAVFATLSLLSPALAQNACDESGPGCRVMATAEVKALKERFLALKAALPVPDPARYALASGVDETYTMPFVAEINIGGGALTCLSWPAGCFIEKNNVSFPYDIRARDKTAKKPKPKDTMEAALAQVQEMFADVENRIEVNASLLPHPYLVNNVNGKCVDVSDPEAVNIEKNAAFLSWESGDGTHLTMVFGPRTCKEAETLRVEKIAPNFAPVRSIELSISGPKADVAALKRKIDRRAFEAILGAAMSGL